MVLLKRAVFFVILISMASCTPGPSRGSDPFLERSDPSAEKQGVIEGSDPLLPLSHRTIVSLSPSLTRQIVDLGASEVLSGITSYCPHVEGAVVVGTLVNPSYEVILRLQPSLILISDIDSAVQKVSRLEETGLKLHRFGRVSSFDDLADQYRDLARLVQKEDAAEERLARYYDELSYVDRKGRVIAAVFAVAGNPMIVAGGRSYMSDMMDRAGLKNVYGHVSLDFGPVSLESLMGARPELIFAMGDQAARSITTLKRNGSFGPQPPHIITLDYEPYSFYTPGDFTASIKELVTLIEDYETGPVKK